MDDAERNDRMLRRIAAALVALAGLAERAAYRSLPVRWLVLCLLRHAESVVREHVAETTGWDWPDLEQAFGIDAADAGIAAGSGSGPADALALAGRLRMLAAVLGALLSPDDGTDRENVGAGRSTGPVEAALRRFVSCRLRHVARSGGWPQWLHDTS